MWFLVVVFVLNPRLFGARSVTTYVWREQEKRRREDCPILQWRAGYLYIPPACPCQATLTRIQLSTHGGMFGSGTNSCFGHNAAQSSSLDWLLYQEELAFIGARWGKTW